MEGGVNRRTVSIGGRFRARRKCAEQGPGGNLDIARKSRKGAPMGKTTHIAGVVKSTALVLIGWISFISSFFVESSTVILILNLIARVLP